MELSKNISSKIGLCVGIAFLFGALCFQLLNSTSSSTSAETKGPSSSATSNQQTPSVPNPTRSPLFRNGKVETVSTEPVADDSPSIRKRYPTPEPTTKPSNLPPLALEMSEVIGQSFWESLILGGFDSNSVTFENARYCIYHYTEDGFVEEEVCKQLGEDTISWGFFDYAARFEGPQRVVDQLQLFFQEPINRRWGIYQVEDSYYIDRASVSHCYNSRTDSMSTKAWTRNEDGSRAYSEEIPFAPAQTN